MFQRRHMEAMAAEVMTWSKTMSKPQIVNNLCSFFAHYNPNFSQERFIKACELFEGELSG